MVFIVMVFMLAGLGEYFAMGNIQAATYYTLIALFFLQIVLDSRRTS